MPKFGTFADDVFITILVAMVTIQNVNPKEISEEDKLLAHFKNTIRYHHSILSCF